MDEELTAEGAYSSVEDMQTIGVDEDDLTLSNGMRIRLRGLPRHDLFFNGKGTEDPSVIETRNLVTCMIKPTMTRDQAEWFMRHAGAGIAGEISHKIRELSGLAEGADKSPVAEV